MSTLQIEKDAAVKAHGNANSKGKKLLEDLFGPKTFQLNVIDRIKSFDDVLRELGIEKSKFHNGLKDLTIDEIAYRKAKLVCQAYNEGWVPNWDNSSEYKYYPWFDMRSSASGGFAYNVCVNWYTVSSVGSRLCFKSGALAKAAGQLFEQEIYKQLFTLNQ